MMLGRTVAAATIILSQTLLPALAQDAPADRSQLYVCGLDSGDGILELTGIENSETVGFSDLQFRAEIAGKPALLFPKHPAPGKGNFYFSNTDGPDGYLMSVRFSQDGTQYRFYSIYVRPNPADENDIGGGSAGLVTTLPDGTSEQVRCGETPYEFITYMQESMSCDTDPRYDADLCNPNNPPQRVAGDALP